VLQSAVVWMCVAVFPGARVPLWQLAQVPLASAWLKVAGVHPVVLWQSPHVFVVDRCVTDLPVAVVPLWQDAQVPVTALWLKFAGVHPLVR
jgi:hypothetical protein